MTVKELLDLLLRADDPDALVVLMDEDGSDYSVVQAANYRPARTLDPYPFPRVELWK